MTYYTLEQLETIIFNTTVQTFNEWYWLYPALQALQQSGCRPNEIFGLPRWTRINNQQFYVLPSKHNLQRTVSIITLQEWNQDNVNAGRAPFYPFSERRLLMYWKRFCPVSEFYVESKPIQLYVMRHVYIKQLVRAGWTLEQIATTMGYTTPAVVTGYANSQIYSI